MKTVNGVIEYAQSERFSLINGAGSGELLINGVENRGVSDDSVTFDGDSDVTFDGDTVTW